MELFRLWPESKRLTCPSFENTTATVNTVIYGVFKLVAHRPLPSVKLWRGLLGSGYRIQRQQVHYHEFFIMSTSQNLSDVRFVS